MNKSRRGGFRAWAGRPGREIKVEDCLRLSITTLRRQGVLAGSWNGKWVWREGSSGRIRSLVHIQATEESIKLSFISMQGRAIQQSIFLKKIPNNYGGHRIFFSCPGCSTRRRFLQLRSGLFLCRDCHDLRYKCQSEDAMDRLWHAQLKLQASLAEGYKRPKGMHLATYNRLRSKIIELEIQRDQMMFDAIQANNSV